MIIRCKSPRHVHPYLPKILALLLAAAALGAGAGTARGYEIGPPLPGDPFVVSSGPAAELTPRVDGDWVTYTVLYPELAEVRYQNLVTGVDLAIPHPVGEGYFQDFSAQISGMTAVFTRFTAAGFSIFRFDLTGGAPVELDPRTSPERERPAIGGSTVAWVDWGLRWRSADIVVHDLATGATVPLTQDLYNTDPQVSPDGGTIVWTRCQPTGSDCDIWQATLADGRWWTSPLAADPSVDEHRPHTDGNVVVYQWGRNPSDIAWRPLGGGSEGRLGMPGNSRFPRVSGSIIAFMNLPPGGTVWESWTYDLHRDTIRQVTFGPRDAAVPDLSVAADGSAWLVWMEGMYPDDSDIYALGFQVPTGTPLDRVYDLRDLVASLGLPHGMATSLTAKLTAAIEALEAGDPATACTKLGDFMAQVQAQSGKALTVDQAAALLAAATEIQPSLGC